MARRTGEYGDSENFVIVDVDRWVGVLVLTPSASRKKERLKTSSVDNDRKFCGKNEEKLKV